MLNENEDTQSMQQDESETDQIPGNEESADEGSEAEESGAEESSDGASPAESQTDTGTKGIKNRNRSRGFGRNKAAKPPKMGKNGEKKKHRCLTCLLTCLISNLVFIAIIIGGSAIAFNKYVSPMIGGVKFGEALRLMGGVYTGEMNRKKILTDTYTEEDLSDFYDELNMHLFQQVRSVDKLEEEYNALSDEEKAAVLTELKANKKWSNNYEAAENKDAVVLQYYVNANRYPITVAKLLSSFDIGNLTADAHISPENQEAFDAYLSTDPIERVSAAAEAESAVQESEEKDTLSSLLSELHFDFRDSGLLGTFDHTKGENDPANIQSVTFEITGNQIAALVGEVVAQVLSKVNLNETMNTEGTEMDLSDIYLPDYILIPQVIIEHKTELSENPTQEEIDDYNKNTFIAVTLEMRIRKLLNNENLQAAVKKTMAGMTSNTSFVNVGLGVVKAILPKTLFLTMGIYPLDADRDAYVKINNYKEKDQNNLAKIINAAAGGNSRVINEEGEKKEDKGVMNNINKKVVDIFGSLDEKGIPLSFVDMTSAEKKKTVGLRLAHVQMLLQMMNAYDPAGEDGITPYLFMTVLKCLFSEGENVAADNGDLDELYTQIEKKYGIEKTHWKDGGLLNSDNMNNITSAIDVKSVELKDNAKMKVNMQDNQLLSLFVTAKNDGTLDDFMNSSETTAAAAESAEEGGTGDLISTLTMNKMDIARVGDSSVYSLTLRATLSIESLLGDYLKNEQSILNTFVDAIPNSLAFGITVYLHTDENGNITKVGADVEGNNPTSFLINAFDEEYSLKVIHTLSVLMRCMGAGDSFQLDNLRDKIDSAFQKVVDTISEKLYCSIGVKIYGVGSEEYPKGANCLVLPSIYEVMQGFSKKKIEENENLTEENDLLTTAEIKGVLETMYHSDYAPAAYEGDPGDVMLVDLQNKYYLSEGWTAEELFSGTTDLSGKVNADSIRFRDPVDGEGHLLKDANGTDIHGIYGDTRTLEQLKVDIAADALADLLTKSKKLDNIIKDSENGMIKSISVVNCAYSREDGCTYANFIFNALLKKEETAAASEEAESDSSEMNVDTLLPDNIFINAKVLLHRDDGDYSAQERFSTEMIVNNDVDATPDLFTLIKVFSGEDFDRNKVTKQVKDSVSESFEHIEKNITILYGDTVDKALRLDTVFAYLADGELAKDEEGKSYYDKTKYMVDIDITGIDDYYETHDAATDPNKTSAETLMLRMRELGKAQYTEGFGDDLVIWQDGAPKAGDGDKYNTKTFVYDDVNKTSTVEQAFYDQLQAYYFFNEDHRPEIGWFKEKEEGGTDNIFDNLTANFKDTFNLNGYTSAFEGTMANYAAAGLYKYNDEQIGARLSDEAMASMMRSLGDDVIKITAENLSKINVTSISTKWNDTDKTLTIEITVEVLMDTEKAPTLPEKLYMTTKTVRDSSDLENIVYHTTMTVNRFAMDEGIATDPGYQAGDLTKFLNNLSHLGSLDVKKQLNTEKICEDVENGLKKMLDDKFKEYIVPFNDYGHDAEGYIEFYNVYHQIVDKLEISRTDFVNADTDIQKVIVKLHNANTTMLDGNKSNGTETVVAGNPVITSDRSFANIVVNSIHGSKNYVNDDYARGIFFVGNHANATFAYWQDILANASNTFTVFEDGKNYILTTLSVNMENEGLAGVKTNIDLLPETIYVSVLIKVDPIEGNSVVSTFLNDLNYEENAMIQSKINNNVMINFNDDIIAIVNNPLYNINGASFYLNEDDTFADYIGRAEKHY